MAAGDLQLAASFTVTVPSAAEVADAVWDEALGGHAGAGSAGAALAGVGVSADPLSALLPGAYAPGTLGHLLTRLVGGPLSVVAPIARTGTLSVIAGDAYEVEDGRQIDLPHAPGDSWPADLTGWDLRFVAGAPGQGAEVAGAVVTAPVPAGEGQALRVELSSSATAGLRPKWRWAVEAEREGRTVTLRHGALDVRSSP